MPPGTPGADPSIAVFAGCLTLAMLSGTAFAARPGGPLYGARLWTEMANLPAGLVDRAHAEVDRLEQRIDEAQRASSAGDDAGTVAALAAYSRIVAEATDGTDLDPAAQATIEASVSQHVALLNQMVQSVPAPARAAAEEALTSTTAALDDLTNAGQKGSNGQGVGSNPPGQAGKPDPGKPGKPDETAKPGNANPGNGNPGNGNPENGNKPTDKPVRPDRP